MNKFENVARMCWGGIVGFLTPASSILTPAIAHLKPWCWFS